VPPVSAPPMAAAGHSLGEYAALHAAGALTFDDTLLLVDERAAAMQDAATAQPGGMVAMLGGDPHAVTELARTLGLTVANDNAPGQVVIAGTPDGLAAASDAAKEAGVRRVTALNVGGAFHTPLMADATAGLVDEAAALTLGVPSAPVVSNHDAQPYADADGWRERLPNHVSVPVRWRSTMDTLVGLGADQFWEVGHGSMIAALAKRGAPDVTVRNFAVPDDLTLEVA